jgi:hypothetical protein
MAEDQQGLPDVQEANRRGLKSLSADAAHDAHALLRDTYTCTKYSMYPLHAAYYGYAPPVLTALEG